MLDHHITVKEAADTLGITPRRVRALVAAGRLPAVKVAGAWLIPAESLESVQDRKPGYPKGRPRK